MLLSIAIPAYNEERATHLKLIQGLILLLYKLFHVEFLLAFLKGNCRINQLSC
jgi:glycosyltransferase involved in cell wall biosynthesis